MVVHDFMKRCSCPGSKKGCTNDSFCSPAWIMVRVRVRDGGRVIVIVRVRVRVRRVRVRVRVWVRVN